MNLTCGHPYATIEEITSVGLVLNDDTTCAKTQFATRFAAKDYFIEGCFTNHKLDGTKMDNDAKNFLQEEKEVKTFVENIKKKCAGQNSCNLKLDDLVMRDECLKVLADRIWYGAEE